jgi:ABC-type branched-subunit amino acid transport system ATPase component
VKRNKSASLCGAQCETLRLTGCFVNAQSSFLPQSNAELIAEFTGLAPVAGETPDALTLHQRKLLELARALACRPDVLFLDEVLTGLNPIELAAGIDLVRGIKELGISIVVVEHIMRVILDLCEHLTVLNFGRVIARGEPRACLEDDDVVTAYLGTSHA